jgi:hypothetical protein
LLNRISLWYFKYEFTSSITYSFSIALFLYYSTAFCTLCYSIFIYRCNVFHYYSLSIILFFSPTSS